MALHPDPIIYCLVDSEPRSFNADDDARATFSLAVNLSLECWSSGEFDEDVEKTAMATFKWFVAAVHRVEFRLYRYVEMSDFEIIPVSPIVVSEKVLGDPADLFGWLYSQDTNPVPEQPVQRYWTSAGVWSPDAAQEAEAAGATHRMRAAQSWNAPVGHRFKLTHIVRLPIDLMGLSFVMLPFFGSGEVNPEPTLRQKLNSGPNVPPEDEAVDVWYYPQGGIARAICRTSVLGAEKTKEFLPSDVDAEALDRDGYFIVDDDADNVRRFLRGFEERSASLIAPHQALGSRQMGPDGYARLFELTFRADSEIESPGAAWMVATSLVSMLDNIALGLLKPVKTPPPGTAPASDNSSEGEILAPLVSCVIGKLEERGGEALEELASDATNITRCLRTVLLESPLLNRTKGANLIGLSLRHVFPVAAADAPEANQLIDALLNSYASGTKQKVSKRLEEYASSVNGKLLDVLTNALIGMSQQLQEESGAERAIIRFIETASIVLTDSVADFSDARLAQSFAQALVPSGNAEQIRAVSAAFIDAWLAYRTLLEGPFNGAEAARRAAGNTFMRTILRYEQQLPFKASTRSERLAAAAAGSDYYVARLLNERQDTCFESLTALLVTPMCPFPDRSKDTIRDHLRLVYEETVGAAVNVAIAPAGRFVPDSAPGPLTVQIGSGMDPDRTEMFGKRLNGIGVAVRRIDEDGGSWAHASLADLSWGSRERGETDKPLQVEAAIHPMLPAIADGRTPMFIEYEGFPFADPAFAERFADEDANGRGSERQAFYNHDPHVSNKLGFAKVPRLAYGRIFEFFAFVTSNAGTLPLLLQDQKLPWMPKPDLQQPSFPVGRVACQRRTAIAQMAMEERQETGKPRRIGATIDGVQPLATDYPRIGLMAEDAIPGTRDMLREVDGAGMIHIPALGRPHGIDLQWTLTDLAWVGRPTKLIFRLFDRRPNGPFDQGKLELVLDGGKIDLNALTKLTLRITQISPSEGSGVPLTRLVELLAGENQLDRQFLDDADSMDAWLRMVLETNVDEPAAVSFANFGSQKPDGVGAPLLLLVPPQDGRKIWRDTVPDAALVRMSTPRVGYLDFERWMANPELRRSAYRVDKDHPATQIFEKALLTAYVMRHLDPKLAWLLDNLPDPAVHSVRIELAIQDRLTLDAHMAARHTHMLDGVLRTLIDSLGLPAKTQALKDDYNAKRNAGERKLGQDDPTPWTPLELRKAVLEPLNRAFQFDVRIAAGEFGLSDKTESGDPHLLASAPEATVARLSLDVLVPMEHFSSKDSQPSAFDERLLQYASRFSSAGSLVAFPASALRIETMYNGLPVLGRDGAVRLAADMIEAVPIEKARQYDLKTAGDVAAIDRNHWRLLSEIDTTTQLWRPTGRPIYHFVKPREYALERYWNRPALPLTLPTTDTALALFEREAFFDRPDIDAHSVTQTLSPLPARTVLQQHSWDAPSATYFRHRFTLRSRYAGALNNLSDRVLSAWPVGKQEESPTPAAWTMRVAMLADPSRILLTRPQLRALIPLTTAPGGEDGERPAPPIAAILQERPFSRGGLADRIAGEIQTGFGYGFDVRDDSLRSKTVEVLDSRKQFGPSPELGYCPTPISTALGMTVRTEGPIGLTFDAVDAAAPAFANTMLSLRPTTLFGEDPPLEDVFAGIAMRRYIDPDWSIGQKVSGENSLNLDSERCWWIRTGQRGTKLYAADGSPTPILLLSVIFGMQTVEVRASKAAIDGVDGAYTSDVQILCVDRQRVESLSLLHQPVAAGRYSICVFANQTAAKTSIGQGNAPLALASFEWSPRNSDEGNKNPPNSISLIVENPHGTQTHARETMASAPTALSWIRTNRDFDYINVARRRQADEDDLGLVVEQHRARHVTARLDTKRTALSFDLSGSVRDVWLASSTLCNPYPVHVHRHVALITTRYLKELGRPVEIFCRTALAGPEGWILADQPGQTSMGGNVDTLEQHVRVVEFETPAAILCGKDVLAPLAYRSAYVDLLSTGFLSGEELRLVLRFVGSADHLKGFTDLVLTLSQPGMLGVDNYKPLEIPIPLATKDKFAVGLNLVLRPGRRSVTGWLTYCDGLTDSLDLDWHKDASLNLEEATQDRPGFFLDVTAKGRGEFWADMSVMHGAPGKNTSAVPLDFGWLFSSSTSEDPASQISPASLNKMVEAQARIVSVSPQIPIVTQ